MSLHVHKYGQRVHCCRCMSSSSDFLEEVQTLPLWTVVECVPYARSSFFENQEGELQRVLRHQAYAVAAGSMVM